MQVPVFTQRNGKLPPLSGGRNLLSKSRVSSAPKKGVFGPVSSTTSAMTSRCSSCGKNRNLLHRPILHLVVAGLCITHSTITTKCPKPGNRQANHARRERAQIFKQGCITRCQMHASLLRPGCVPHLPLPFRTVSS